MKHWILSVNFANVSCLACSRCRCLCKISCSLSTSLKRDLQSSSDASAWFMSSQDKTPLHLWLKACSSWAKLSAGIWNRKQKKIKHVELYYAGLLTVWPWSGNDISINARMMGVGLCLKPRIIADCLIREREMSVIRPLVQRKQLCLRWRNRVSSYPRSFRRSGAQRYIRLCRWEQNRKVHSR